jgi:hypothetical protein
MKKWAGRVRQRPGYRPKNGREPFDKLRAGSGARPRRSDQEAIVSSGDGERL